MTLTLEELKALVADENCPTSSELIPVFAEALAQMSREYTCAQIALEGEARNAADESLLALIVSEISDVNFKINGIVDAGTNLDKVRELVAYLESLDADDDGVLDPIKALTDRVDALQMVADSANANATAARDEAQQLALDILEHRTTVDQAIATCNARLDALVVKVDENYQVVVDLKEQVDANTARLDILEAQVGEALEGADGKIIDVIRAENCENGKRLMGSVVEGMELAAAKYAVGCEVKPALVAAMPQDEVAEEVAEDAPPAL